MFCIENNEKNESVVILNPEVGVGISGASVEIVVNDGVKTKRYSAKRDLYGPSLRSTLKMTNKALSLSGASSEKQKESSLVQRKSERQAIFKFTLSSASGGAGGGKYNRISAFVSMPVLLIRRSLEKFFKKNFRDDRFCFGFAKVLALALIFTIITISKSLADNITSGTCGDDCTWSFSNGTLKIVGNIKNYGNGSDTPWFGSRSSIKTIDASESTGFGTCSFENLEEVTKVIMPKQINGIPAETFRSCAKLENLEFPDGLQYIGGLALSQMYKLKSITIPDSATFIYSDIFEESSNISTIYCKGDISACRNNLAKAGINHLTVLTAPEEQCQNSSNYYFTGTECTNRPENPDDITCVGGYAKLKNNCVDPLKTFAKKRWTPAEANEWLHDGNDNFVIITFKK